MELNEIRAQQDLLFRFMNFLKQEGAVHVLQFCLAVGKSSEHAQNFRGIRVPNQPRAWSPPEEFNNRILSPDLSDPELQRLHTEVRHIYETYCLDESVDKINFDRFIVEEIRNSKRNLPDSSDTSGEPPLIPDQTPTSLR